MIKAMSETGKPDGKEAVNKDNLSPVAQKIKEGILEKDRGPYYDEGFVPDEQLRRVEQIAHRKANELWVGDEEIKKERDGLENEKEPPLPLSEDYLDGHEDGEYTMRDRLFKSKNEEE